MGKNSKTGSLTEFKLKIAKYAFVVCMTSFAIAVCAFVSHEHGLSFWSGYISILSGLVSFFNWLDSKIVISEVEKSESDEYTIETKENKIE